MSDTFSSPFLASFSVLEADWTTGKHPLEGLYRKTIKHTG